MEAKGMLDDYLDEKSWVDDEDSQKDENQSEQN